MQNMGYTDGHKGGVKRLNPPTHNDTKGKWYLERKEGRIGPTIMTSSA